MFQALAERFDTFGGVLAVAALAGALGGMVLGRFIDMGHARRSVWLNAVILAAGLILKLFAAAIPLPSSASPSRPRCSAGSTSPTG